MNSAIQQKLDFYNIQLEYSTEEYIPAEQSATFIEIGIDIEDYEQHDRWFAIQHIHIFLEQLRDYITDFATTIKGDIYYITLFRSKDTINSHIKIIEELLEHLDDTDMNYLTSTITLNDTS